MALIDEIQAKSKEIHADSYGMSLGEIINMYRDGDLDIHPEFQRFFRWSEMQKTRLIESFLLNIPIPPIFVSQREDGIWDVVDGLQRLSTIFQFVGIYKDENGNSLPPLKLHGTENLPSLEGKVYMNDDDPDNAFTDQERRYLKRAKINLTILLKESDRSSKYELFQRLNTGGTSLSDQEVRNCLIVMTDPSKFNILENLSKDDNFTSCLRLNERSYEERFDLELVTRFICLRHIGIEDLSGIQDFGEFLNKKIVEITSNPEFNWEEEQRVFHRTFEYLNTKCGDNVFCKYDAQHNRYRGGFNTGAFEIFAIALGRRNGEIDENFDFVNKQKDFWANANGHTSWKGYNASGRLKITLEEGKAFYENQEH
jgi:hypothetical protein